MKNRLSYRLKDYNYSNAGSYFITINIQDKLCLFGKIQNSKMILNPAGIMIKKTYNELTNRFQNIKLHEYVIMPNHMHCVIEITENKKDTHGHNNRTPTRGVHTKNVKRSPTAVVGTGLVPVLKNEVPVRECDVVAHNENTIGDIIGAFKSLTTIGYIKMININLVLPFDGKLWQKRFYDHIIRNEKDLNRIQEYIKNNPLNWKTDSVFVK